ncbi:SMP-30/gluconolactonase/LRE family protein [Embleya sp. NPDC050493]|uniref:SMP-30/gluconolactonase/LRE family protein n=1 Tax=Embleya sp. NPDC050493 TaxID=3363989 RepID=UPI0037A11046
MSEWTVLREDIVFGESVRWHRDRVWFCDWGAREIVAVGPDGVGEVVVGVPFPSMPMCIDWLPDGRLLIVSSAEARVVSLEADGSLATHADLRGLGTGFNEIVVHGRGHAYVNAIGFDMAAGEPFRLGFVALIGADGSARRVAGDVVFPNGMAVTADGSTLIVAESYGNRLTAFDIAPDGGLSGRRVWADLGDGVPDGICVDAEGAVWYADVPNKCCVRVREGGEVLSRVESDRGCFSCALGGADGGTLFVAATEWRGMDDPTGGPRTGRLVAVPVSVPAAGR